MMETHRIPRLAALAMKHAEDTLKAHQQAFEAHADEIGRQAVAALGLDPEDDWIADFTTGVIARKTTTPPSDAATAASP